MEIICSVIMFDKVYAEMMNDPCGINSHNLILPRATEKRCKNLTFVTISHNLKSLFINISKIKIGDIELISVWKNVNIKENSYRDMIFFTRWFIMKNQ